MTSNNNIILSAQDIVVEFDVRDRVLTAIRGVSLELEEGEVLALVGESGSGKSVLTKTFTGMLEDNGRIAQGSIKYRGQELTDLKSNKDWENIRGSKIATIFQDPMTSLDPINTIGSQITEVIIKHQGKTAKEAKEISGVEESKMVHAVNRLVQIIGILIIPLGLLLFFRSFISNQETLQVALEELIAEEYIYMEGSYVYQNTKS